MPTAKPMASANPIRTMRLFASINICRPLLSKLQLSLEARRCKFLDLRQWKKLALPTFKEFIFGNHFCSALNDATPFEFVQIVQRKIKFS
jgi:hypothetical protein